MAAPGYLDTLAALTVFTLAAVIFCHYQARPLYPSDTHKLKAET